MGVFGNAVAWVRGRFESEQAALDREAGERYDAHLASDGVRGPSTAGPGLIGAAEIGRARTVEHTDWQDVAGSGEVRHAILRDDAGFYVRLEDDLLGQRNYALGPFPSLDLARDEAQRSVEAKAVAVEVGRADSGRDPYILTAQERVEIEAWEQAERDRVDEWEPPKDRVETVHTSEWTTTSPAHEERTHIGRSEEGWHYAIEASRDGGDRYEDGLPWSPARPSREEAETALDDAQHARFMRDTASHDRDDEEHGL